MVDLLWNSYSPYVFTGVMRKGRLAVVVFVECSVALIFTVPMDNSDVTLLKDGPSHILLHSDNSVSCTEQASKCWYYRHVY